MISLWIGQVVNAMPARIVEIDATNASCLDAVAPDVFDNAVDAVQLNRFVGDPRHILVVAIDDGLVVGMATAVEYFHPDKAPQLWINEVGVSPAYRGRRMRTRRAVFLNACTERCVEVARSLGSRLLRTNVPGF